MNTEFCSKALYTGDAKLNEMWSQVYFILGLVFSLHYCSKAHVNFIVDFEKRENWVN